MAADSANDWRPTAALAALRLRARLLAQVRAFFAERGVLEVETPILSSAGTTDPQLHSFVARSLAPGDRGGALYLHTSPEFAMKRLLAAGSGSIYQLCKAFRAGEVGRRHNPEFTLLEWYRVGYDYLELMDESVALVTAVLNGVRVLGACEKLSYRDAFLRYADLDSHAACAAEFAAAAQARGIDVQGLANADVDDWRALLLTHVIEPHLGQGRVTCLYDYPASQPALARVRDDNPAVAERFELYLDGIELANGYQELSDAAEQRRRFAQDRGVRAKRGHADMPADLRLLTALEHGLPPCSGVALGFDRLLTIAAGASSLADVVALPVDRA